MGLGQKSTLVCDRAACVPGVLSRPDPQLQAGVERSSHVHRYLQRGGHTAQCHLL